MLQPSKQQHSGQALLNQSVGVAPQIGARGRVLHANGKDVYIGRGLDLLRSSDGGQRFQFVARAPGSALNFRLAQNPVTSRLLRTGFHDLLVPANGDLLAIVRGALLHKQEEEAHFKIAHRVKNGSRPLNICESASGRFFFGEYYSNPERDVVHIYGSEGGREWDIVGNFPVGTVRHVHGIHADPHRGGMWVLTGDNDEEAGLWWTDDEFRNLEPVWRGTQSVRAVTMFAESFGLIVPTDSPFERNYIQHLDPENGAIERLAELPGSSFHSARTENLLLVSTVVEKSTINTDPRPALFASKNGMDWVQVAQLPRDTPPFGRNSHYFQWPTIVLPSGRVRGETIFASGQSLEGAHDRLLLWKESDFLGHDTDSSQEDAA